MGEENIKEVIWEKEIEGVKIKKVKTQYKYTGCQCLGNCDCSSRVYPINIRYTAKGVSRAFDKIEQAISNGKSHNKNILKRDFYEYLIGKGIDSLDKLKEQIK